MAKPNEFRRYRLIIEILEDRSLPTKEEIREFILEDGIPMSDSTLSRDFKGLRNDFGIEIECDKKNRYYINKEKSINVKGFFRFLEITRVAELFTASVKDGKNTLQHVSFSSKSQLHGIGNLEVLLDAVKSNRLIQFEHLNFKTEKTTSYLIEPYLLREYENRWYVVGHVPQESKFKIFGIDRISELKIKSKKFARKKGNDPIRQFDNVIGADISNLEPMEIKLKFTPELAPYIKSLPLHESQSRIDEDKPGYTISLYLCHNHELLQQILKYGSNVKVLGPPQLVKEVKDCLSASLEQYK